MAFEAQIAGLKVLDGPMTDSLEGVAFTKGKDLIDVYSCSWGPDDDGKTVDGPHFIALVSCLGPGCSSSKHCCVPLLFNYHICNFYIRFSNYSYQEKKHRYGHSGPELF